MGSFVQTRFLTMVFGIWVLATSPSVFADDPQVLRPKTETQRRKKPVLRNEVLRREQGRANRKWRKEDPQGFENEMRRQLGPTKPKKAVPVPTLTKDEHTELRELRNDDGSHTETINGLRKSHNDRKSVPGGSPENFHDSKDRRIKGLMTKPE